MRLAAFAIVLETMAYQWLILPGRGDDPRPVDRNVELLEQLVEHIGLDQRLPDKGEFLSKMVAGGIMSSDEARDKLNLARRGGAADELRAQTALPPPHRSRKGTAMSKRKLPKVALGARPGVQGDLSPRALQRWSPDVRAADPGEASISVLAPIGADPWGEGVTARRISAALRAIGERAVTVNINMAE
ncbi:hypothetical protein [Rhodovulum sulfidophilum]|uniref:hypothetical protein n=1 Tax=Rhodovulum sulfidophilum TaxID=35806 RepID=UPI000951E912|nr:hypothetical protein [Rhodovulum sulfidophilum]MBL3551337.1 hypothetical protein [Rhodovulum sulfidophilum]OLS48624.1 hypothetical protein BV379_10350 [Rhodovulum sulfidophilum]